MTPTSCPRRTRSRSTATPTPRLGRADLHDRRRRRSGAGRPARRVPRGHQHHRAISAGNSGGPAVDESGHVVGIATWETFDEDGAAFSRIRPINLARPVIDAAIDGERIHARPGRSAAPGRRGSRSGTTAHPATAGVVTQRCTDTAAGAIRRPCAMEYNGLPARPAHRRGGRALRPDGRRTGSGWPPASRRTRRSCRPRGA